MVIATIDGHVVSWANDCGGPRTSPNIASAQPLPERQTTFASLDSSTTSTPVSFDPINPFSYPDNYCGSSKPWARIDPEAGSSDGFIFLNQGMPGTAHDGAAYVSPKHQHIVIRS